MLIEVENIDPKPLAAKSYFVGHAQIDGKAVPVAFTRTVVQDAAARAASNAAEETLGSTSMLVSAIEWLAQGLSLLALRVQRFLARPR